MHASGGIVRQGDMTSNLLKPDAVAKRLNLSCCTVLRMIENGELPAICLRQGKRKRTYRIYEAALEMWLKRRTVVPATRLSRKPSSGPHTNGGDSFTHVLTQDTQPMEVIEKSSGELDSPSGSQGVNDGR